MKIKMKYYCIFSVCFHVQGEYGGGNQKKTSGTLHLFNITLEDDGIYICVTHSPLLNISKKSKPAKLTVQGEFVFFLLLYLSFHTGKLSLHVWFLTVYQN